MTQREKRKLAIQELVKSHVINDQAKLIELLEKNYGIKTNQAVVSRDLRNLDISKRTHGEAIAYELPHIDVAQEILRYAIRSIEHNETTIIINTVAGTADFVGDFLDKQQDLDILGTLAGENVVFVAPRSIKTITELYQNLCKHFKVTG